MNRYLKEKRYEFPSYFYFWYMCNCRRKRFKIPLHRNRAIIKAHKNIKRKKV